MPPHQWSGLLVGLAILVLAGVGRGEHACPGPPPGGGGYRTTGPPQRCPTW